MALTKIKTQSINDDAITTAKINNNAVTDAKVADDITAGAATTAATLATARSINGVSFNGSSAITVTAAAGTLTGSTLASGVTASSLTSVGTLTALTGGTGDLIWDTTTLVVDSSANRVGIGTASPDHELHVEGENPRIQIESTSAGDDNTGLIFAHGGTEKYELWHDEDVGAFNFDQSVQTDGWGFNFRTYPSGGSDNTTAMTIKGSGNVGIGETSPLGKLHIKEDDSGVSSVNSNFDQLVLEDDSHCGISILSGTSGDGAIYFGDSGTNDIGQIKYKHSSNSLDLTTNSQTRMTIDSNGNVGISTASPKGLLHIEKDLGNTSGALATMASHHLVLATGGGTDDTVGMGFYASGDEYIGAAIQFKRTSNAGTGDLTFYVKDTADESSGDPPTAVMTMTDDLNVGIGVGSPTSGKLCINSGDGSNTVKQADHTALIIDDIWGWQLLGTDGDVGLGQYKVQGGTGHWMYKQGRGHNTSNDFHKWYTNDTERMSINSSGDTTIAGTLTSGRLWSSASVSGNYISQFINSHGSEPYGINIHYSGVDVNSGASRFITCTGTSTVRMWVLSSGTVQNATNTYGSTSDSRVKQDITDANSQWNDIKALRVRNFKKKDNIDLAQIGLIAQEVEESGMLGLIEETSPSEFEIENCGIAENDTVKGVKYSVLYMKAIKCLQEAMERIEALENA